MNLQTLIVLAVIALAVAYVFRKFTRRRPPRRGGKPDVPLSQLTKKRDERRR